MTNKKWILVRTLLLLILAAGIGLLGFQLGQWNGLHHRSHDEDSVGERLRRMPVPPAPAIDHYEVAFTPDFLVEEPLFPIRPTPLEMAEPEELEKSPEVDSDATSENHASSTEPTASKSADEQPDASPEPAPEPVDWLTLIREEVPPLRNPRGLRMPMIVWECCGRLPLDEADVRMLLDRGFTQFVRLVERDLATALALQKAGSPVIVMQGRLGEWPYDLAGEPEQWAHRYPEPDTPEEESDKTKQGDDSEQDSERSDQKEESKDLIPKPWRKEPMPLRITGWQKAAEEFRAMLKRFKEAGVHLDAVWLDYENRPSGSDYRAAIASFDTQKRLPKGALASPRVYHHYTRQLWMGLLSAYIAAPFREFYPEVSITNWVATFSTPEYPALSWFGNAHPTSGPTLFNASNPIAYAIDLAWLHEWKSHYPMDRDHVDQYYMHVLLRQISADAYNRNRIAPSIRSYPWVARWVPEAGIDKAPVMSRRRYREALRHLWLRDVDGMQVFNSQRGDHWQMALAELQDAVQIYDEMLAFAPFLESGEPISFTSPRLLDDSPFWSGKRLGSYAVIRTVTLGPEPSEVVLLPWPRHSVVLPATREGETFLLRKGKGGSVEMLKRWPGETFPDAASLFPNQSNSDRTSQKEGESPQRDGT
ncbi:MAG: hypothetical protein HQL50_04380 [Magnetococcales bacterium]|nr:hypothetical protein [Magnetococcales bacterium]